MSDKHTFVDSNVILYLFTNDIIKKNIAETLLSSQYTISTQVVSENVNVCLKKLRFSKEEAFAHGKNLMEIFKVANIYAPSIIRAFEISIKYELSYWDSLIAATALDAKCHTLLSEDMQNGLIIEKKLKITNPFVRY